MEYMGVKNIWRMFGGVRVELPDWEGAAITDVDTDTDTAALSIFCYSSGR